MPENTLNTDKQSGTPEPKRQIRNDLTALDIAKLFGNESDRWTRYRKPEIKWIFYWLPETTWIVKRKYTQAFIDELYPLVAQVYGRVPLVLDGETIYVPGSENVVKMQEIGVCHTLQSYAEMIWQREDVDPNPLPFGASAGAASQTAGPDDEVIDAEPIVEREVVGRETGTIVKADVYLAPRIAGDVEQSTQEAAVQLGNVIGSNLHGLTHFTFSAIQTQFKQMTLNAALSGINEGLNLATQQVTGNVEAPQSMGVETTVQHQKPGSGAGK